MIDILCELPEDNPTSEEIKEILVQCQTIAVVGLSPKEHRDSNMVARYMKEKGFRIIPVNPGQKEILGEKCYRNLLEIPFKPDMVNLFLNPERVPAIVDQAIEINADVIWMQLGVIHNQAATKARAKGIKVIMDKCLKTEHEKMRP
jgi:predicted CoA-binding protein